MSPARWCCLGLIAVGVLLTSVDLVNYCLGLRAMAEMAGVSWTTVIRHWILRRPVPYLVALGTHVGPIGQWGLGCVVIGFTGIVLLELRGKSTKTSGP